MDTLFTIEPTLPEGFHYVADFLTEHEEQELYREISKINLHTFTFQGYEAKRKVASFGFDYNFERQTLTKGEVIPKVFDSLLKKLLSILILRQMILQNYWLRNIL